MRPRRVSLTVLLLLVPLLVAQGLVACSSSDSSETTGPPATIRFASYDFQENQILAEVYAEAVRRAGLPVSVAHGVGTREVVSPALQQGVVDVAIDYLGTALAFTRPDLSDLPEAPEEMRTILGEALEERGVLLLDPSRAEDQNGFAVTTTFAAGHRIRRISELAPLAGNLTFGGPPECPDRPYCLGGLQKVYGLQFGEVRDMPSRAATVEALLAGEIDVGLLETTDARLAVAPVLLLLDDKALQPHENVVPLVRTDAVERWGEELRAALNRTSARLTTADLVRLNRAVEIEGMSVQEAAQRWWEG